MAPAVTRSIRTYCIASVPLVMEILLICTFAHTYVCFYGKIRDLSFPFLSLLYVHKRDTLDSNKQIVFLLCVCLIGIYLQRGTKLYLNSVNSHPIYISYGLHLFRLGLYYKCTVWSTNQFSVMPINQLKGPKKVSFNRFII